MKTLTIIPICGLANRLRMIACGSILAEEFNLDLKILWGKENCCNASICDIFESNYFKLTSNEEIAKDKYIFNGHIHTEKLIPQFNSFIYKNSHNNFVLMGGHDFKHPEMELETFLYLKSKFYQKLRFSKKVNLILKDYEYLDKVQITNSNNNFVGFHHRAYIEKFDSADNMNFNKIANDESYFKIIKQLKIKNLKLISNDVNFYYKLKNKFKDSLNILYYQPSNLDRDSIIGLQYAMADLIRLSQCPIILGTHSSSFSDEASFFYLIPKLLIESETIAKESDNYHCYGIKKIDRFKILNYSKDIIEEYVNI